VPVSSALTKAMRIRRRADFLSVQARGAKVHTRNFVAICADSALPQGRLGLTVSRRVGNAVVRNRVKRLVREWFRTHGWVKPGKDLVVVARSSAGAVGGMSEVAADLAQIQGKT
jgi:ribonuclease P protein component